MSFLPLSLESNQVPCFGMREFVFVRTGIIQWALGFRRAGGESGAGEWLGR